MKNIIVICKNCGSELLRSIDLTKKEAEKKLPNLKLTSVFNSPKCKKCNNEVYPDITLGTELKIVNAIKDYENT